MATPEMDSRCIYCTSAGPFSAEHMIPAGLGADDKRFLLRDMVCKVCNTNVFSTLELEWLRNSPTAIARIFMQEKGRQRGSKRQSPKLGAGQKVVITPEGYTAEADSATEEGRRFFHSLFLQTSDDATWRALTKKDSVHLFRHSGDCSGRRLCVPVGQRQRERAGSKSPRLSGWMMGMLRRIKPQPMRYRFLACCTFPSSRIQRESMGRTAGSFNAATGSWYCSSGARCCLGAH